MLIDAITSDMSVAEASEMLGRLLDSEISVIVPECNKDKVRETLEEENCDILVSEPQMMDNWLYVVNSELLKDPELIEELEENGCTLEFDYI